MSVQGFQIDIDLGELSNISLTGSPAALNGEVLKFDGVNWVNSPDIGLVDVVDDLSPQLGGDLSVNGQVITAEPAATTTSNGNDVHITSTNGGAVSGTGGDIIFELGYGTTTGDVVITSSDATGTYRPGLRFLEASTNGINFVELKGPTNITADRTWTLPVDDPTAVVGQFITTDATGNLSFAPSASITIDNFADGGSPSGYISGTTTELTLSVDPLTENNIQVMFDGVAQHHDQYSVSGTTLTFSVAIPIGTDDVEVIIISDLHIIGPINAVDIEETKVSYGTTGAISIDTSDSKFFYPTGTTTGVITFTFDNPEATNVTSFTMIGQGLGNNAPVWPAGVEWAGGAEPTWTTGKDMVSFMSYDAGVTWLGKLGGLAFA